MKRIVHYSLFIISIGLIHSQKAEIKYDDDFSFQFVMKKNETFNPFNKTGFHVIPGESFEKLKVRFKVNSNSGKRINFDPNKFYLLDDNRKQRLRPVELRYKYWQGYYSFPFLLHVPLEKDYEMSSFSYSPEINDTFKNYYKIGYKDIPS